MKNNSTFLKAIIIAVLIIVLGMNSQSWAQNQAPDINETETYLETIGIMCSTNLYLSYISITLIKKSIEQNKNNDLSESYQQISNSVKSSEDLIKNRMSVIKSMGNLSDEDVEFLEELEQAYNMLNDELDLLSKYFESKNDKDFKIFVKKHELLYNYLTDLFHRDKTE